MRRHRLLLLLPLLAVLAALASSAGAAVHGGPGSHHTTRRALAMLEVEGDARVAVAGPPVFSASVNGGGWGEEPGHQQRNLRVMKQHALINDLMASVFLALAIAAVGGIACCVVRCDASRVCPCLCGDPRRAPEALGGEEDIEESPALKQEAAAADASASGAVGVVSSGSVEKQDGHVIEMPALKEGEEEVASTGKTTTAVTEAEEEEGEKGASEAEAASAVPFSLGASAASLLGLLGLSSRAVSEGGDKAATVKDEGAKATADQQAQETS